MMQAVCILALFRKESYTAPNCLRPQKPFSGSPVNRQPFTQPFHCLAEFDSALFIQPIGQFAYYRYFYQKNYLKKLAHLISSNILYSACVLLFLLCAFFFLFMYGENSTFLLLNRVHGHGLDIFFLTYD